MQHTEEVATEVRQKSTVPRMLVVIGAGAGGPAALTNVVPKLPHALSASTIIVQQMRPGFTRLLAEHLASISGIAVEEAENHELLRAGQHLMVPGSHSASVVRGAIADHPYILNLRDESESIVRMRARIDTCMKSAAELFGPKAVGVLLTGAGTDGREGLRAIRNAGGTTIVQDQDSSILYDMPKAAIDAGVVDETLPLWNIADRLIDLIGDN